MAIDVGANVGNHAVGAARQVGRHGLVLAIEPNPEVYWELLNAVRGARVVALPFAASDKNGWVDLHVPLSERGAMEAQLGSIAPRGPDAQNETLQLTVPAVRLDDVVPADWEVSAMKIDVEGHEAAVLEGARVILTRWHPRLIVEIEQRHLGANRTVDEVVETVCALGYRCGAITRTGVMPWPQFDVERDQLQWLTGSAGTSIRAGAPYVNNFTFWRDANTDRKSAFT